MCGVCGVYTHVYTWVGSAFGGGARHFFHLKANSDQEARPRRIPSSSLSTAAAVNYFYNHLSQIILKKTVC